MLRCMTPHSVKVLIHPGRKTTTVCVLVQQHRGAWRTEIRRTVRNLPAETIGSVLNDVAEAVALAMSMAETAPAEE